MKPEFSPWAPTAALGLLLSLPLVGCSTEKVDSVFRDNEPPEVRLTAAPVSSQDRYYYAYRMNWVGFDPDGRVDYYLIAVDPPHLDHVDLDAKNVDGLPVWQRTTNNEQIVFFRATSPDTVHTVLSEDPHTFAIVAVDNDRTMSKPVHRSFFSFTEAPNVWVEQPRPNAVFTPIVTPTVRIRWRGEDRDGVFTTKPVKYKYRLFAKNNPDFPSIPDFVQFIVGDPKFLVRNYAPTFGPSEKCPTCTAWDSSSAETTEVQYTNLIPNQIYAFVVTGFDEAGAYDPSFTLGDNLLKFAVSYAGTLGPVICMANDFFNYCYQTGGWANDETRYVNLEVPVDQPVTFNWIAFPPEGASMRRYRWVMDLNDLSDETPRINELTDWNHWSAWGAQNNSATVGPFHNAPETHIFYIEAEDNNGLRSLGIIRFTIVRATFEKDILFVDDARLQPDQRGLDGKISPPNGTWPSAAELDTFFFARGGFPWKDYPPTNGQPTLSPQGIFAGYPHDTVGTRGILSGIMPLATLGKYKLVVWYTDDAGSTYNGDPAALLDPITSLRLMSSPGHPSTISTYLKQGGKVWMFGGGAAYATLFPWSKRNTPTDDWTFDDGELIQGRFMYDFPHWQTNVGSRPARQALLNSSDFSPYTRTLDRVTYTGHGMNHDLSNPNYGRLLSDPQMTVLQGRTCTSDPPSAVRFCNSFYLVSYYTAEYLGRNPNYGSVPNIIREDANPSPDTLQEVSTLDTLYLAVGGTVPSGARIPPVMTYYHGFQTPQVVFSGFPLWYFQKAQAKKLADFVLEEIFNFHPSAAGFAGGAGAPAGARQPSFADVRAGVSTAALKVKSPVIPLRR